MKFSASILGASGFGGGELLRLVEEHPAFYLAAAGASTQAGKPVTSVFPGLRSLSGVSFCSTEEALQQPVDVLFSSLPHGQSSKLFARPSSRAVIDLAGDFRLRDPEMYERWYGEPHPAASSLGDWIYGLTEFHRTELSAAHRDPLEGAGVANPGCYAAASILALGPFLEQNMIDPREIHISAVSGVSGAGRAQGKGFDFVSANENVRPYKPAGHNHIGEIEQELSIAGGAPVQISFVPHLVPMNRGILVTAAARALAPVDQDGWDRVLQDRYDGEPFVRVLQAPALPETRRVSGTNVAEVAVAADRRTGKVLAFAAIDNLGKGAAGQAIQNANILLGLEETSGLGAESPIA